MGNDTHQFVCQLCLTKFAEGVFDAPESSLPTTSRHTPRLGQPSASPLELGKQRTKESEHRNSDIPQALTSNKWLYLPKLWMLVSHFEVLSDRKFYQHKPIEIPPVNVAISEGNDLPNNIAVLQDYQTFPDLLISFLSQKSISHSHAVCCLPFIILMILSCHRSWYCSVVFLHFYGILTLCVLFA